MWKQISILCLAVMFSSQNIAQVNSNSDQLSLENCHLKGIKEQVKCGSLTVLENYQKPNGLTLDVNVVVLPAIDRSSDKEPLMFLAGGPGQAATELSAHLKKTFAQIRKNRDIILVDQRGTGQSNPLICDNAKFEQQNVYTSSVSDIKAEDVTQCVQSFEQDLSQYNSENAIRDFDAVRAALGHQKINIYGGSYGTRAALVYMRMFPQHLRSVVLDSVGPIEVPIGTFGQSAARSFSLLMDNCQNAKACENAFPQLAKNYQKVFNQLTADPVNVTIQHPRLGTPTDFIIDVDKFVNTVRLQLYSMSMRTMVPLVIEQAAKGNFLPFAGLIAMSDEEKPVGNIYVALTLNIVCNEDFPRLTESDWQRDANNDFGRNTSHRLWQLACPLWPKYTPSADFYQPVTADIPTLILSGNLDPVTPPSNGEKSASTLPNNKHIVVKNAAHIVANNECGVGLVAQFLDKLSPNDIDESCIADIPDETFMTSLNGNT